MQEDYVLTCVDVDKDYFEVKIFSVLFQVFRDMLDNVHEVYCVVVPLLDGFAERYDLFEASKGLV